MDSPWLVAAVPVLALALDAAFGEPPNRWHPVRWLGQLVAWMERRAPACPPAALAYGLASVAACGALVVALAALAQHALFAQADEGRLPAWLSLWAHLALLKPTFAVRALLDAGAAVERALGADDLPGARRLVGWHLVSRPVEGLDRPRVAAAAIESLAENTCDGIVAPLWWWALGGLPGAWCYRLINTVDAMWGYRGRYEFLGKGPARLDDVASWAPARMTALLLCAAGWGGAGDVAEGLRAWRRDAARTESPNAGHPMAAAAGLLGVRLEKVGAYLLYPEGRLPEADHIRRTRQLVRRTAWLSAALLGVAGAVLRSLPPLRLAAVALAATFSLAGVARHVRRWRPEPVHPPAG